MSTYKHETADEILQHAQAMSELCGENWIQRVGVWVEAAKKLAALVRTLEHDRDEP